MICPKGGDPVFEIYTAEPLQKKRKQFESKQKGLHYLGQVVVWI